MLLCFVEQTPTVLFFKMIWVNPPEHRVVYPQYGSAFSRVLDPHLPHLSLFGLNVPLNVIFIILNICLENKGMLNLAAGLTARAISHHGKENDLNFKVGSGSLRPLPSGCAVAWVTFMGTQPVPQMSMQTVLVFKVLSKWHTKRFSLGLKIPPPWPPSSYSLEHFGFAKPIAILFQEGRCFSKEFCY